MKYIITIFLVVFVSVTANAQVKGFKENRDSVIKQSISKLKNNISISQSQELEIKLARENEAKCIDSIVLSFIPHPEVFKKKTKGCVENYQKKLAKILSESQLEQYRKMEKDIALEKRKQSKTGK